MRLSVDPPSWCRCQFQASVNVDATGNHGATARTSQRAQMGGPTIASTSSLTNGASMNARDSSGETPSTGTSHHCRRMWPLFLRAGAEIPTDNTDSRTSYESETCRRIPDTRKPTPPTRHPETPLLLPAPLPKGPQVWLHAGYRPHSVLALFYDCNALDGNRRDA